MLETRKLLPGVRPKTRIEALTLAIFLAESELVEACHNPKTREWAIECKAAILTYQEMLEQENTKMCDKNINTALMSDEELAAKRRELSAIDTILGQEQNRRFLDRRNRAHNEHVIQGQDRLARLKAAEADTIRQFQEQQAAEKVAAQQRRELTPEDAVRSARSKTDYFMGIVTQPKGE